MNGAIAEPLVSTIRPPKITIMIMIGSSQNFLRFCDTETEPFYNALGWQALERGRVVVKDDGGEPEDLVMILGERTRLPAVLELEWSW